MFEILSTATLTAAQKHRIFQIWNEEYPAQIAYKDVGGFEEFLAKSNKHRHFIVEEPGGKIMAWLMIFEREQGNWFSIIVDGNAQGKGYGSRLIQCLKEAVPNVKGWAVDHDNYQTLSGRPYQSPLNFYRKHGFTVTGRRWDNGQLSSVMIYWEG